MRVPRKSLKNIPFDQLSFRDQLGLSQSQMADYLGIKASQLGMAEIRQRSLPKKAVSKDQRMMQAYVESIKKLDDDSLFPPQQVWEKDEIEKEMDTLRFQKQKLLRNLEKMETPFKKARLLYQFCTHLQTLTPESEKVGKSAVDLWQQYAERDLTKYSKLEQARIRFRTEEIERKIAFLEGWLKET